MRAVLKFWSDTTKDEVSEKAVDARITEFKMYPFAAWRLVISDTKKKLRKGEPEVVRIQRVELPKKTLVKPLSIPHHPRVVILGLMSCGIPTMVEERKRLDEVVVYPTNNCEIDYGDLLGVFEVQFVETGILKGIKSKEITNFVGYSELKEVKMVLEGCDGILRKKLSVPSFEYRMSPMAYWVPVVCDENAEVDRGEIVKLSIKNIELPPNTVVKPLCGINHALGTVVDVTGDVKLVEEEKSLNGALFAAVRSGIVEEGDLIGALNVYYVATRDKTVQFREVEQQMVSVTNFEGGKVVRKKIVTNAVGYMRSFSGYWIPVVSEEDVEVKKGEITVVKVRDIIIPEYTVVSLLHIPTHAFGCILDIRVPRPRRIEERKSISEIIFLPTADGKIETGDLLGSLSVHSVYTTWDLILFPSEPKLTFDDIKRMGAFIFTE